MENGENGFDRKLADKMSSLELNDPSNISDNDSLFQVMKAVEAAEATIKQQVEENDRLRTELQDKIQELEKHKSYEQTRRWGKNVDETYGVHESTTSVGNPEDGINIKSLRRSSLVDQRGSPFPHNDSVLDDGGAREISTEGHSESSRLNGTMKLTSSGQTPAEVPVLTQFSSPSTSSISLIRYPEAEYDPKVNSSGHGLVPMAEANNSNSFPKQVREHEQEIAQLRRYLAEFSVREVQIHNEKSVLEKRIAYMRLAFDQQQQDLVDASSKALSYRQDIMEENIRLSYQLQAAQQDRLTFVSSLLPLLAEYSLQPPAPDAHSIVSNVKVLFKHLQEQLHITESRLKDSQFQLAPWPPAETIPSHFAIQSPGHLVGGVALNNDGHELMAKGNFIPNKPPPSSSHAQMPVRMDGFTEHQAGFAGLLQRNIEHDEVGRYSPPASRNPMPRSLHRQYDNSHGDAHKPRPSDEPPKQVKFRDPVSSMDDPDAEVHPNGPESSATWAPGNDDPSSSYSPYLQPVLEEPSSSFSEAGPDDDPLPAVDGLQISGDAVPGRELQASGYSINGTTSCNFEWVRHIADGSVKYIEGAKQPSYLVTADDVDNYLAIEVQPLDNRKRKGELVKVFANDNRKISLEPGMQACLESAHHSGSASFRVEISTGYLDIWEPAVLTIKREGYNIKSNTPNGVNVTEKFSRDTIVTIPHGHPTAFSILDPNYEDNILRSESGPEDVGNCRDTIVLILRLFIMRAGQKPAKGKRKGLFFKK